MARGSLLALLCVGGCAFLVGRPIRAAPPKRTRTRVASAGAAKETQLDLSVLIAGAGPSGLLLAHLLLAAGARVRLLEARQDPREPGSLEGRAYALGLGIRGRTAIRAAGEKLWDAIKPSGFASERFKLHIAPELAIDLRSPEDNKGLEPSLLIYQSDLCSAMLDELEANQGSGRLEVSFQSSLESVDPTAGTAKIKAGDQLQEVSVDLIAGCDGVNSVVRSSIAAACPAFEVEEAKLPGRFKVLRFPRMPKSLDAAAVHAIGGPGGSSAFVEPTAGGACALINFKEGGKPEGLPGLWELKDAPQARETLAAYFPLIEDALDEEAAQQFVSQKASQASTVRCNSYHFGRAVLLGDAAHSTGGASGQGCNSALQDSVALAEILQAQGADCVPEALERYSQRQVPEGHALLDLSLGPGDSAGPIRKALYGLASLAGTLLSKLGVAEPPLQTLLTTNLMPFSEIRRNQNFYFGDFPTEEEFNAVIQKTSH
ncbi:unnamed protein product [Effrenium voratum]|uniref:FAD-binding domain-containing protein n=1 Tax=Effrenium voratum TaxID=2562239 RepID=A0AA36I5H5_9DINO|nr:unnamed protein product [Effrenium voratum]CAJ1412715.1 unnamed protein product [Effrenium voratum]